VDQSQLYPSVYGDRSGSSHVSFLPIEEVSILYPKEQAMSRTCDDVTRSTAEIRAYCKTLAKELDLTLDYIVSGCALTPPTPGAPYNLTVSIVKPFEADPQFWFTAEKVRGYTTGATKAVIENEIRHDLESRIREYLSTSRKPSCTHG
jgi:hypothetical protein